MLMKYHIEINEKDYIDFNIYHFHHSEIGKKTRQRVWIFSILLCIVFAVTIFLLCDSMNMQKLFPIIGTGIYLLIVIYNMLFRYKSRVRKGIIRNLERQKKDGALPFAKSKDIEFLENEFFEITEEATIHIPYENFVRVEYTEDWIYMYMDSQRASLIPYSALGDDKDKVVEFIKSKIKS